MIWINWNLQSTNGTKTFLRCERHYATIIWMTYELHYENINAVSRQAYSTISSQEIRRKSRRNRKEEEGDYLMRGNQRTMRQMVVVYIIIELNWAAWNGSSLHTNSCPDRSRQNRIPWYRFWAYKDNVLLKRQKGRGRGRGRGWRKLKKEECTFSSSSSPSFSSSFF